MGSVEVLRTAYNVARSCVGLRRTSYVLRFQSRRIDCGPGYVFAYLIRQEQVRLVAFTGSTAVGRQLTTLASENMTSVLMELGGQVSSIESKKMVLNDSSLGSTKAFYGVTANKWEYLTVKRGLKTDTSKSRSTLIRKKDCNSR